MIGTIRRVNREARKGSAVVELAVSVPLIALMTFGIVDFGRLFFHGVAVASASAAGAFFGGYNNLTASDSTGIVNMATGSATDLDAAAAEALLYCDCPDDPASGPDDTARVVDCSTGTCPVSGYDMPRVFVRAQVTHTFSTLAPYPGIPNATSMTGNTYLRVQ